MKRKVWVAAGAAVAVIVAAVIVAQLMPRSRRDGSLTVDPAVERKIAGKDREILRTKIATAFPQWVQAWGSASGRFSPSSLRRESIEMIDSSLITREDHVDVPVDDESLRALASPDETKYLEYTGSTGEGEPDTELSLVDAPKNERRRLLFFGPSVRIDDAAWTDNETIIVVGEGTEEAEPQEDAVQPLVWIFHLPEQLVSTYTIAR